MGMIIAVLRIVIPLVFILVILRLVWPRYKAYKEQQANIIEVEAEVVNSKQPEASKETPTDTQESKTK